MAHNSSLPERLRYLQPFRRKFLSRPSEELDEVAGPAALFPLIQKRIWGYAPAEAEKLLEEDAAVLQTWLAAPGQENDPLHFAEGLFLITSPSELIQLLREESEKQKLPLPWVEMDLPTGARVQRFEREGDGGMLIKWKGLVVTLGTLPEEAVAHVTQLEVQGKPGNEVSVSPVRFGDVTGTKIVSTGETWRGPYKEVRYILTAPGGHIHGSACALGKKADELRWDESKIETCFHSLRIVLKQPPLVDP